MQAKYCIDIFGRCPKKFRNRSYEHSLALHIDKNYKWLRRTFESSGLPASWIKKYKRKRQYGGRINQNFK